MSNQDTITMTKNGNSKEMIDWKNCPGYLVITQQVSSLVKEIRASNEKSDIKDENINRQLEEIKSEQHSIKEDIKKNKEDGDKRAEKVSEDITIIKEGMKNFVWLKRIMAATYITGMGGLIFWIIREVINHLNGG